MYDRTVGALVPIGRALTNAMLTKLDTEWMENKPSLCLGSCDDFNANKQLWNTFETLLGHFCKHFVYTFETFVEHFWNTGETVVKH